MTDLTAVDRRSPTTAGRPNGVHPALAAALRPVVVSGVGGPTDPHQTPPPDPHGNGGPPARRRWTAGLPLGLALTLVAGVWLGGCVWSFEEQAAFAQFKHFHLPWLLPLVIDGLAISMGAVAYAASLDARPAVLARIGTTFAVALSAASNVAWAWERSAADPGTMALAAVVPILANVAFEVLLAELRRQVLRRRGIPGPLKLPYPSLRSMVLSPWKTFFTWRRLVLAATDLEPQFAAAKAAASVDPDTGVTQTPPVDPTPRPKRTPIAAKPKTNQTPSPKKPSPPKRAIVGPASRDAADLTKLRVAYPDRTPSINEVQQTVGGGRARALRLRGLLDQTPSPNGVTP